NPDGRLRRHAARQGWTCVDWGTPVSALVPLVAS
ncbi:MAG: HAD-IB family hydrolase, partial [Deltaproteobacteria bacterium]|nr:HAD-IB family hydrolase [Deltaproteobacteria bacterium]